MPRISTRADGDDTPRIDRDAVAAFFEERARKYHQLGPIRTAIYQDKHPDLAVLRDAAEKELLWDKLNLSPHNRVLDIGCGTGRWAGALAAASGAYHGVDNSAGLIGLARERYGSLSNVRFTVCSIEDMSASVLGTADFDRLLVLGVLIYLNDDEVPKALRALSEVAAERTRVVMREPVGLPDRLTIKDHYSAEMEQTYNAIYRTENELVGLLDAELRPFGFRLVGRGDVYSDPALNNRAETRQRWFVLER